MKEVALPVHSRNKTGRNRIRQRDLVEQGLFLSPLILVLICVAFLPTLYAVWLSFNKVTLQNINEPIFSGLRNYQIVLGESQFWYSLRFTLRFALVTTAIELVAGLGLAVLFNRPFPGKGIAISLLLLPMMVSPALIGTMIRLQINEFVGPIAYIVQLIGFNSGNLITGKYVFYTLVAIDLIQQSPFIFLTLYAALQGVPIEILEAAVVDGASYWQRFWQVTFPIIIPFLMIAVLLRGIDSFLVFALIYVLTGGGPGILTQSMNIYIYNKAFIHSNFGEAGAAAVLLLLILIVPAIWISNNIGKREA